MSRLGELVEQFFEDAKPTPDAVGYPGVPAGLGYPGTVVDGYVYDVPHKPGYQYFRSTLGVETEIGVAIIGGVRVNPNRELTFYREGPALVAQRPNATSAVAGDGVDAWENWLEDHRHDAGEIDYTPTTPGDWDTVPTTGQGALDALAAVSALAGDSSAFDAAVEAAVAGLLADGANITRLTLAGVGGSRRMNDVARALLKRPYTG